MSDTPDDGDPTVVLIAAVAENGVIGRDGEMPWHHPEDLRHFRRTTTGHPVVMGRRTYDSVVADVGGPLPDRTNVVLTSGDPELPVGAVAARSVEEALARAAAAPGGETVYVAGGATVYEQLLARADRMVLTEVHETPPGDTHFPDVEWENWREVARDDGETLSFVTYERVD
jgi:dihydrofolate reductase